MPAQLSHARYAQEILSQTRALAETLRITDLDARVPSCPEWNVVQLARHVGFGHRWAADLVRRGADSPTPDTELRTLDDDPAVPLEELVGWLDEGAALLSSALLDAGADAALWTPVPGGTAAFYARRFTHETLMHRADASLAGTTGFTVDAAMAADAITEWMDLGTLPMMLEVHPRRRELLGPDRTVLFRPTDDDAGWLVDLTGDLLAWHPANESHDRAAPAAVTVRAPLTTLLLLIYRRVGLDRGDVTVEGDRGLLEFWQERVAFG